MRVKLDPTRLGALAQIVRRRQAARVGVVQELRDLRAKRKDLKAAAEAAAGPGPTSFFRSLSKKADAAALATELAALDAAIAAAEADLADTGADFGAAKANLRTALALAKAENLTIPHGVEALAQ
uniref:Uncharacterized protein n=1 Tax=Cereibacter sphaeroides (strain ATCC 17025 / ATH 2.4.3) TaxID=349102 RepID=A4WNQ3_CERS5